MPIPRSANIKIYLLITAILIIFATLLYTQHIVQKLIVKEREIARLYAQSLEYIINAPTEYADYSFIFNEIIPAIDFPMILTNSSNEPIPPFKDNARNVDLDTNLTEKEQYNYLLKIISELNKDNPPLRVKLHDTLVLNYVHYGESKLIKQLRWLPIIEITIIGLFIIIGYIAFSYIKRSEQSNIWVGMAKETAHQLGTPLSSLMGWLEILKNHDPNYPVDNNTLKEVENDLNRLQKITERFSKIGSKPTLKVENINETITSVIDYYHRRLPSRFAKGKNIELGIESNEIVNATINRELFEWVIENLIKNALDAIEDNTGKISFSITSKGKWAIIDVKDTGKGINMKYRKDIFRPGYSTKKRGWGLGLSLSKRIIESYHKGKLFVRESKIGKGTTFRIKLIR